MKLRGWDDKSLKTEGTEFVEIDENLDSPHLAQLVKKSKADSVFGSCDNLETLLIAESSNNKSKMTSGSYWKKRSPFDRFLSFFGL